MHDLWLLNNIEVVCLVLAVIISVLALAGWAIWRIWKKRKINKKLAAQQTK